MSDGGTAQVLVTADVKANLAGAFKNVASVTSGQPVVQFEERRG